MPRRNIDGTFIWTQADVNFIINYYISLSAQMVKDLGHKNKNADSFLAFVVDSPILRDEDLQPPWDEIFVKQSVNNCYNNIYTILNDSELRKLLSSSQISYYNDKMRELKNHFKGYNFSLNMSNEKL